MLVCYSPKCNIALFMKTTSVYTANCETVIYVRVSSERSLLFLAFFIFCFCSLLNIYLGKSYGFQLTSIFFFCLQFLFTFFLLSLPFLLLWNYICFFMLNFRITVHDKYCLCSLCNINYFWLVGNSLTALSCMNYPTCFFFLFCVKTYLLSILCTFYSLINSFVIWNHLKTGWCNSLLIMDLMLVFMLTEFIFGL